MAVAVAVAAGVGLRAWSPSALWLDEAISASISGLPIGEVPEALRHDGAPPLYALLLWGWERLFGASPEAVRSLSALFGVAALPLAATAGARLGGRAAGVAALLLLASSPFAIYYSTEARMYSLVVLLVLWGVLVLHGYLRRPGTARGVLVALVTAALALTHYWSLFLLAVVAGGLLTRSATTRSAVPLRAVGWMAAGGLVFLPWLPTFLYQFAHTGTPWSVPAGYTALLSTASEWSGGTGTTARLLELLLLLLAGAGVTAPAAAGRWWQPAPHGRAPGRALAGTAVGTLLLALTVGRFTGAAFAARYTSVVLPLFLLVAALGAARLPARARAGILVVAVTAGLAGAVPHVVYGGKTQAPVVAAALRSQALPGDIVVYCPDQLGPATSRLLPPSLELQQEVYPTGGPPARVDWVDYAARNRAADPVAYAQDLSRRAGDRVVWLVSFGGYRTYGTQCQRLARTLTDLRGQPLLLVESDPSYFEHAQVLGWAPAPARPPR